VNVIVIGAGIIGCAVGYELASRGVRVRLLDGRGVGQGATQASAGVLCPHIEGHSASLRRLGVRSLDMYDEFVARVASDANRSIEYRRTGTLEVALNAAEAERLQAVAAAHASEGIDHEYVGPRSAIDLEPTLSPQIAGALLVPVHGYVGVAGLTDALAAAVERRGGTIERGVSVRSLSRAGGALQVEANGSVYEADAVVIAAGSWSSLIKIGEAAPVRPIRGQLLHLSCASAPPSRVIWGSECYLVPWQDGSLLVGATVEDVGFDERATVAGVRNLVDRACDLLPLVANAAFGGVRVGLRPATSDELPIVGRSTTDGGVYYATGHYRNGVLLAPLTGAAVADLIVNDITSPELAVTNPARFGL